MQPVSRSVSSASHWADCEYGSVVRTPPGAAWYSSTAAVADRRRAEVPLIEEAAQGPAVHGAHTLVEQAGPGQLAEDRRDAAGPVHVLDVVVAARRDLAQAGHPPGQLVDLLEAEVHLALVAAASRCRMVLVEPPMATSSAIALSNASRLAISRGRTEASSCS